VGSRARARPRASPGSRRGRAAPRRWPPHPACGSPNGRVAGSRSVTTAARGPSSSPLQVAPKWPHPDGESRVRPGTAASSPPPIRLSSPEHAAGITRMRARHRVAAGPCVRRGRSVSASGARRLVLGDSASDELLGAAEIRTPLFGEALAREGQCGPWRRSRCRRGGARRVLARDRRSGGRPANSDVGAATGTAVARRPIVKALVRRQRLNPLFADSRIDADWCRTGVASSASCQHCVVSHGPNST
jgi:hypothetical protein